MKHAIAISAAGANGDPRTLSDLARLAEDVGWDGIFVDDYIVFWDGSATYDPWIALAAMAMTTERIRLGTGVTPLARRRPWKVAREALTLDHLSNGRFTLGVGLGVGSMTDFDGFGEITDDRQRARQLEEALEIIVGLWSAEPFSFHGEFYQVKDVMLLPAPVQKPRIPIWVGGGYPNRGPTARAARWDGSLLYKQTHGAPWLDMLPQDVADLVAFVRSRRVESAPYEIAVGGRERGEDWDREREYLDQIEKAGATWWLEAIPPADVSTMESWIGRGPLRVD